MGREYPNFCRVFYSISNFPVLETLLRSQGIDGQFHQTMSFSSVEVTSLSPQLTKRRVVTGPRSGFIRKSALNDHCFNDQLVSSRSSLSMCKLVKGLLENPVFPWGERPHGLQIHHPTMSQEVQRESFEEGREWGEILKTSRTRVSWGKDM